MPSRFPRHHAILRATQQLQQLLITGRIFTMSGAVLRALRQSGNRQGGGSKSMLNSIKSAAHGGGTSRKKFYDN